MLLNASFLFVRLAVASNNITGKGLLALSDALKTNTVLSYIYIWGNKFDEPTCMVSAFFIAELFSVIPSAIQLMCCL